MGAKHDINAPDIMGAQSIANIRRKQKQGLIVHSMAKNKSGHDYHVPDRSPNLPYYSIF